MPAKAPTAATLQSLLNQLNFEYRQIGAPAVSYTDVSQACGIGRSTAHALLTGTYKSRNRAAHAIKIQAWLRIRLSRFPKPKSLPRVSPRTPRAAALSSGSASASTPRPPRLQTVRVHTTGFFLIGRQHYYAGSLFAGHNVTAAKERRSDYIRITCNNSSRLCRPVDPAGNQLGYTPDAAR